MDNIEKQMYLLKNSNCPTLCTFNDIAIPIGIIESNVNQDISNWLISNFMGLHYRLTWNQIVFNTRKFYHWDCFNSRKILLANASLDRFSSTIIQSILNNEYIYMFVNEYYLPSRTHYYKSNFIHDLCVYGFDNKKRLFYISAYNTEKKYTFQCVKFEELYAAFINFYVPFRQIEKSIWKNRILAFRLKDNFNFQNIKVKQVNNCIYRYCTSLNLGYGINIYQFIDHHINKVLQQKSNLDLRLFRILTEHIYIVSLLKHEAINHQQSVTCAERIFLTAIKYTLTNKDKLLQNIKNDLLFLKSYEIESLEPYIKENFTQFKLKRIYRRLTKQQLKLMID